MSLDAVDRPSRISQAQIRANIRESRRMGMVGHHALPELPASSQLKRLQTSGTPQELDRTLALQSAVQRKILQAQICHSKAACNRM